MRKFCVFFLLAGLLQACNTTSPSSGPQASESPTQAIPAGLQEQVSAAEFFGLDIYLQDIAAWKATDFFDTQDDFKSDTRLQGWLAFADLGEDDIPHASVAYVGEVDGELRKLYEVEIHDFEVDESTYVHSKNGSELTALESAQFAARRTAFNTEIDACGQSYNAATISIAMPDEEEVHFVYLMPAMTNATDVMAGGNYRILVDASGENILEKTALSKSCIVLQRQEEALALTLTHLVQPTPNAIHVYLSLLHQMPLYVSTTENNHLWLVKGNTISLIQ